MPEVCIIIPCFNEALRLNCDYFLKYLRENAMVSLCFVNDGSTDNTLAVLNKMKQANEAGIFIIDIKKNKGKANAVRQGMLEAPANGNFKFIGFWDADISTPLEELNFFLNAFEENKKIKLAIGSRVKRLGANIYRKTSRHIMGRIFSTFTGYILKLPVYDSQCGAKLFSNDIIITIFDQPFVTSWLFDVEILARLRNKYGEKEVLRMVTEIPLSDWKEVGGSKIKFKHFMQVPFQLFKIHIKYNSNK